MMPRKYCLIFFCLLFFISSCKWTDFVPFVGGGDDREIKDIGGDPSAGAEDIYDSADLTDLCVDDSICSPDYDQLPDDLINTDNQEPLDVTVCNFDYDPNEISTFVVNRVDGSVNGLELLLSKEDLFFLAWVSVRYKINPYFLLGVLSQESAGNCAAVSSSNGEGCFQITNTFGQGQLDESYPVRVLDWFWTDRSGEYYPDDIFVEPASYFGEVPPSDQFRLTLDPTSNRIDGTDISSVINFNFGIIASGLYFHWQPYLLYYFFDHLRDEAEDLFQTDDGKALWQAAAYNGGVYGASLALQAEGNDFLDEMGSEPQTYAPAVVDYCKGYQAGELTYSETFTQDDVEWFIDLISMTYPDDLVVDWEAVKDDVFQVFFADGTTELSFVDDVKAIVYVISTHVPELGPEWPDEDSI